MLLRAPATEQSSLATHWATMPISQLDTDCSALGQCNEQKKSAIRPDANAGASNGTAMIKLMMIAGERVRLSWLMNSCSDSVAGAVVPWPSHRLLAGQFGAGWPPSLPSPLLPQFSLADFPFLRVDYSRYSDAATSHCFPGHFALRYKAPIVR